jgi:hypothetical protein
MHLRSSEAMIVDEGKYFFDFAFQLHNSVLLDLVLFILESPPVKVLILIDCSHVQLWALFLDLTTEIADFFVLKI